MSNPLKMRGNGSPVPSKIRVIIDIDPVTGRSVLSSSGALNPFALCGVLLSQLQATLENLAKSAMGIIDTNKPRIVTDNPDMVSPENGEPEKTQ